MKRFALSYFTAVTTLLIVISSTGMSTGKNNTGLTRSNRPGQNSKRYFKAEYTTDFSPLQPSVNVQTESIKSYRTAGNNPRLSTVGSSSIRKLPAARETSLNRDNAKAMALSLRSRFRFSKLDSVSPDFYRFNDNYKAKVNNRSLLSAYGAKVMSKFAAMPVEIRRSFPTISRHVTLTPYSFTGDVEEIMRMGPGKMKSRVQNLPTSVTDQYRRSRVRRRAQREDVINGLLADGSDVLMRGERSELNDDSQHSSLYKWLDDTHLNKNTNDYLNEIFKGVYMWLAQPETESELAPVSFTSDSLDGRYLDDTHTFLEERNNERTSQYLDEMLLPSLADTDEYGSDTDNGFSAVSKRGRQLKDKIISFLTQNPSDPIRIPLQGPARSTRIYEKHEGSSSKHRPLELSVQSDEACPLESDGSKPLRCPSDPDKCLYDGMICDGTSDCPKGEDETFALCVLRHWSMRWMRKLRPRS